MSEMNEYTPDLFELIDAAELHGEQYFALVPAAEDEDFLGSDCDPVILKSIYENDEEILASIDDDEEFEEVSAFFLGRLQEVLENYDEFDEDWE